MFTSSVLNNSFRMSDTTSLTGGLHLNALNGSCNVLGYNNSCSGEGAASSSPDNAFGGLFGVSLSENHPYRPLDSGRSFHESSSNIKHSYSSSSPNREDALLQKRHSGHASSGNSSNAINHISETSLTTGGASSNIPTAIPKERRFVSHSPLSRRRQYMYHTDSSDSLSPLSMRRYSLNIDTDRISTHAQCGSDLSLSLEDICTPRCADGASELFASHGSNSSRTIKSNKVSSRRNSKEEDLDIRRLSITQVDIDTSDMGPAHTRSHGHHSGRRSKRQHAVSDASGNMTLENIRAVKLLDKIKESKKTDQSKNKLRASNTASLATREKSPRPSSTSRHHVTHSSHATTSSMSSAKKDLKQRNHKSTFSRNSFD